MTNERSEMLTQRQLAISRWENEGGSGAPHDAMGALLCATAIAQTAIMAATPSAQPAAPLQHVRLRPPPAVRDARQFTPEGTLP